MMKVNVLLDNCVNHIFFVFNALNVYN